MNPDDDLPEITDGMLAHADLRIGERVIRRGRPPLESPKQAIKLRLDAEVVEHFRETGPGWQTRINEALRHTIAGLSRHAPVSTRLAKASRKTTIEEQTGLQTNRPRVAAKKRPATKVKRSAKSRAGR
jgi:BrnA antitoxin of type II toxin-antitoxin system